MLGGVGHVDDGPVPGGCVVDEPVGDASAMHDCFDGECPGDVCGAEEPGPVVWAEVFGAGADLDEGGPVGFVAHEEVCWAFGCGGSHDVYPAEVDEVVADFVFAGTACGGGAAVMGSIA